MDSDDRSWSARSKSGDLLRGVCVPTERVDLILCKVFTEIVWPASGEASTIVFGVAVGGGERLSERNKGWMLLSSGSFSLGRRGGR